MRRLMVLLAAMAVMVVGYAATAWAATVVNGGFETGDTSGWTVVNEASESVGDWYVCSSDPEACDAPLLSSFPPPEGTYAAISSQEGAGSHILYQDVTLEAGATHQLSFTTYYQNYADGFYTPDSLSYQTDTNQQYRIDIMKPDAPVDSVAPEDILATVFRTQVGDPEIMEPTPMTFDLSQFAGSTVRLRFAEVDNLSSFVAGVDDVKVTSVTTTDTTPPTVTATTPDGTVSRTATVTATFDEDVQNVTSSTFFLERQIAAKVKTDPPKYVLVDATVDPSDDPNDVNVYVLDPTLDLPKGDYRATITKDVTDMADNPLEDPVVWTFTVKK